MQNTSLEHINPSHLKNFFRKLCILSSKYAEKDNYLETATEEMLRARVQELEEELQLAREEKDKTLEENRNKINELNLAVLSIKTEINELLQAKEEKELRMKNLDRKMREKLK